MFEVTFTFANGEEFTRRMSESEFRAEAGTFMEFDHFQTAVTVKRVES